MLTSNISVHFDQSMLLLPPRLNHIYTCRCLKVAFYHVLNVNTGNDCLTSLQDR